MNEYSILMQLFTNGSITHPDSIGINEEDLCVALGFTGRNRFEQLYALLESFSRSISPFGLVLRQNPFTQHWFLTQSLEIDDTFASNPFEDSQRLGATLCAILLFVVGTGKSLSIQELQEIRGKKDLQPDLKLLVEKHFIILEDQNIRLDPNVGNYMDLDRFLQLFQSSIERNSAVTSVNEEKTQEKKVPDENCMELDEPKELP